MLDMQPEDKSSGGRVFLPTEQWAAIYAAKGALD